MRTTLEVKEDGLIYVIDGMPEEHYSKGCHSELQCESESLTFAEQFCGCYNRYQQDKSEAGRILCADQEQAKEAIINSYLKRGDGPPFKYRGSLVIGLGEGIYQVPVEWETFEPSARTSGYSDDNDFITHTGKVAILRESPACDYREGCGTVDCTCEKESPKGITIEDIQAAKDALGEPGISAIRIIENSILPDDMIVVSSYLFKQIKANTDEKRV